MAASSPRWLVVVRPEHAHRATRLRTGFDPALVEVVVDRRRSERRRHGGALTGPERRRAERRGGPTGRYRPSYRGAGFDVYEARGRTLVHCGACGGAFESELPHFHEPPARLTVQVVHVERAVAGLPWSAPDSLRVQIKHSVEVQAFTTSGRPVLSCRVPARPPAAFAADEWVRQIAAAAGSRGPGG